MKSILTSLFILVSVGLFATSPVISYSGPKVYTVGTAITSLTPTNTGGAASVYGTVSTFCSAGGQPHGMAFNSDYSFMYTGLKSVHRIGKVNMSTGISATFAGNGTGFNDATGTAALFAAPYGTAVHPITGDIYVADQGNNRIRKITTAGDVTTYAGTGTASTVNGSISTATLNNPCGLIFDTDGTLYVLTSGSSAIRKIDAAGTTVTSVIQNIGSITFHFAFSNGFFYVSDANANSSIIYKIALADGTKSVIAGSATAGSADGTGAAAQFSGPRGIAVDANGIIYVADYSNSKIRKITTDGVVTTIAGVGTNTVTTDGIGLAAAFRSPAGLVLDGKGNLYVGDAGSSLIRKVAVDVNPNANPYSISPALPAGLTLNTQTGVISGTPTAAATATDYTITATNATGSSQAILNLSVNIANGLNDLLTNPLSVSVSNGEIKIMGEIGKNAAASLYDIQGKMLLTKNLLEANRNVFTAPILKDGLYILWVKDNTGSQKIKLLLR
jgi:sugar lactone lactonase YvrE